MIPKKYPRWLRLDFLGFTTEEYDAFYHLSRRDRLRAVVAFLLFITVTVLAAVPFILAMAPPDPAVQLALCLLTALTFYGSNPALLLMLFPHWRDNMKRFSRTVFIVVMALSLLLGMGLSYSVKQRDAALEEAALEEAALEEAALEQSDGVAVAPEAAEDDDAGKPSPELYETIANWAVLTAVPIIFSVIVGLRWLLLILRRLHTNAARREMELELASQIQERLIPPLEVHRGPLSLYGRSRLALEVGGDGFEVVELRPTSTAPPTEIPNQWSLITAVSDVSGHGTGAGLLMALLKGAFQAEAHHRHRLDRLAAALDRSLYANSTRQMYATLCAVRLDASATSTSAEVVDAGHLPLLHYSTKTNTVEHVKAGGLGLGLTGKATYKTHKLDLTPGDVLLLLTDGLIETRRHSKDGPIGPELGLSRVQVHFHDAVRAAGPTSEFDPERYVESLFAWVQEFQGDDEPPDDDQTAVCVVVGASS